MEYGQWNYMNPRDVTQPRVFLCKAGRFLENLNFQMGGSGTVKERFGNERFENTCDPDDLLPEQPPEELPEEDIILDDDLSTLESDPGLEEDSADHTVAVIDARDDGGQDESFHDLPVMVIEGLRKPVADETEEELVSSVLSKMVDKFPESSVRRAIRLPITQQTNDRSLVLVEMDTEDNENKVLQRRKDLLKKAQTKNSKASDLTVLRNLGIRRAKYRELWRFVEELSVVKRVVTEPPSTSSVVEAKRDNQFVPLETSASVSIQVDGQTS